MGNYKPTMRHYTTMDSDKYYELLWQNSGFADASYMELAVNCAPHSWRLVSCVMKCIFSIKHSEDGSLSKQEEPFLWQMKQRQVSAL